MPAAGISRLAAPARRTIMHAHPSGMPRVADIFISYKSGDRDALIVGGPIGVKEIEQLIARLQLDKEILADQDGETKEGRRLRRPNSGGRKNERG